MTYTQARANLAALCDRVTADRNVVIIDRRGAEDVALVSAAELASLQESVHLLRSPANAKRLMAALVRAGCGTVEPQSLQELRRAVELEEKI
jgi:antitoxin YefM